ncbi:MAG: protein kinase domain-containing protein [Chthoniobacterales bacterium]
MKPAASSAGICAACGTPLDETSALGCMVCLLDAGLEEQCLTSPAEEPPERFGTYVLERDEGGRFLELGRGAMAITYRARDTSLQRMVALKLIRAERITRGTEARERFMREARAAAALRHPNVATVYQFGIREENGQCYSAMELVEGETLAQRVRRCGPLDALTVIEIALQVTSALAAAEKQGLVHRDLKPGNLMLVEAMDESGLTVKVIDFGLAKALTETPDPMTLTHGEFVGTPAFASPEQFSSAPIDVRSDIYSLGATLCFLLTGQLPFPGADVEAMRAERTAHALPLAQLKAARVPPCLLTLLADMLQPQPAARPGVRELDARLQRCRSQLVDSGKTTRRLAAAALVIGSAAAIAFWAHDLEEKIASSALLTPETTPEQDISKTIRSVAVLPLRNLTGNPENEYLTDGITEGLIRGLSKAEGLKVISRTSVFAFKEKEIDPREIGRQLDAVTIVQGSIRQSQSGVRVSVQLVRTSDGSAIWSGESFDHTLSNALTLESELIRSVAVAIRPNLRDEQQNRMAGRYTENSEAYQVYLRGRYLWNKRTGADAEQAIRCFEQAISLDPNFALAYSGLADVYVTQGYFTDRPFSETLPKARAAAEKALSVDNNLSDAHATLAFILGGDMDLARAEKEYKLALDLDPDCPTAHSRYAFLLMHTGRLEQSLREMQRAVELDPLSIETNTDLGSVLNVSSHFDEAVARYQIALAMDQNFTDAHGGLGCTYRRKGDLRRSIAELETARQLSPKRADLLGELGCSYALAGEIDKATSVIEELKAMPPRTNVSPRDLAKVFAELKQSDKAVDSLESAYQMRRDSVYDIYTDPIFDSVRAEPRVQRMLVAIGAPH